MYAAVRTNDQALMEALDKAGKGEFRIRAAEGGEPAAVLRFGGSGDWTAVTAELDAAALLKSAEAAGRPVSPEKMPILIRYTGRGKVDLRSFTLG